MIFPYGELESIRKQSDSDHEYLDQLASIGSYALDDLEEISEDITTKEAFRELNIAFTGLADFITSKEIEK